MQIESYPVGRAGRSVDGRMHTGIVKNEEDVVANTLPPKMFNYVRDSFQYNEEVVDIGFNRNGIVGNNCRGDAEFGLDSASGYDDHLALKDHCMNTGYDKKHCIDMQLQPNISGCFSGNLSGEARVHEDDRLRVSDSIMSERIAKLRQRTVFLDDDPGLHNSDFNQSLFSNKPMSDHDSLFQNQLRTTTAMLHPSKAHISDDFCVAQRDLSSKSIPLYDPDAPAFGIRQPSPVRIRVNDSSKPILETASASNNYRRNNFYSLSDRPSYMPVELNNTNQFEDGSCGLGNRVLCESNKTGMPSYVAQSSEPFAAKSVEHEGHDCIPLNFNSSPVPRSPLDMGNLSRGYEPYSSLYQMYNSCISNDAPSGALQENLDHEVTLLGNNETYSPVIAWENEGCSEVQYCDPLIHEHDLDYECRQNYESSNSGYKNKNSVFSRLSFVKGFDNREYGSNNSIDEVMEMVRQSHKQPMMKRKPRPLVKHSKTEILRDQRQHISSSWLKRASVEKSLDDTNTDMTIASEGKTNRIAESDQMAEPEDKRFVDFKRRSHARKTSEENKIGGSNENCRSEDSGIVQQKKRKLIRPNFSSSTTSDNKDINLGASQNLRVPSSQESSEPKDNSKSCHALAESEENIKKDGEQLDLASQTHLEEQTKGQFISNIRFRDGSERPENLDGQNASSDSCEIKTFHNKEGLCMKDNVQPMSSDSELQHSIPQAHTEDKVIDGSTDVNTEVVEEDDRLPAMTIEVKDRFESSQNLANETAPTATCKKRTCTVEKGSKMHYEKDKALPSITENVNRHCCYPGESEIASKIPDSINSCLNSVGINTSVQKN